jgi:hypothetical protein
MATVTSNLTRINDLEGALTFASIGSGTGAGANTDIFLQGNQSAARRRSNVTLEGFWLDDTVNNDLSAADIHVGMWVWVTQYGQLTALEMWVGTSTANYDRHALNLAEFPTLGGWVRMWVDISRTPTGTGGTGLNEAQARYFGLVVSLPTVGGTTPNVAMDAIDHTTTGLTLTGTSGVWSDFTTADENSTNQYGVLRQISGILYCYARLTLGTASSLAFSGSNFAIVFVQQALVADTFMGISVDLQNASTAVTWDTGIIQSSGTKRGDIVVTGTSGTFNVSACVFSDIRIVTLTVACDVQGSTFNNCGLITIAGAILNNCVINGTTATASALWNTNADPDGELDGTEFIFGAAGHGLELGSNTPTTITLRDVFFTGFGADGTTDAALYNNSGKTITINIVGGTTPTVRNGAGANTILVAGTVTTQITVIDADDFTPVQSARVIVTASNNAGPMPFEEVVTITRSGSTATVSHTGHGLIDGKQVLIKGANQPEYNGVFTITVTGPNAYTYTVSGTPATPATGTIEATGVVINGTTDVNGQISDVRAHAADQPIIGRVRKATTGTLYKTAPIAGTISNTAGLSVTVQMVKDT